MLYIDHPTRINEINLRASHLVVHGYWNDELLLVANFKKEKGEYVLTEPLPALKLIEENSAGFLEYQIEGNTNRIQVYERSGEGADLELYLIE